MIILKNNNKDMKTDTSILYHGADNELVVYEDGEEVIYNTQETNVDIIVLVNNDNKQLIKIDNNLHMLLETMDKYKKDYDVVNSLYLELCDFIIRRDNEEEDIKIELKNRLQHIIHNEDTDFVKLVKILFKEYNSVIDDMKELTGLVDRLNKYIAEKELDKYADIS